MKKNYILTLILSIFISQFFAQPEDKLNIIDKGKVQYKIQDGKQKLYSNNFRGALKVFREVLAVDKDNAVANYHVAECHYALNKFDLALKYVEKAAELKPDVNKELHFLMGQIYHRLERLDEAKEHYQKFKAEYKNEKKLIDEYDIDIMIAQCDYAKEMMQKPIDVTIENLGDNINGTSPEYSASVTADGKTIIFTSRRSDTKGGNVDQEYDHQYYEDIYISTWDEERGEWTPAEGVPGKLNTEFHDACLNISPDGEGIYVYKNIPRATKSGDIYYSKKNAKGTYGTPKPIKIEGVNSSYFESSVSMTADESMLVFISDKPGGEGLADIYMCKKTDRSWSEPVNLGPTINTPLDEKAVFIHPSGKYLFFSSQGHKSMGGYDIFMSTMVDGKWSEPVNMGYPINTVNEERTFSITADGKTAYISAFYKDSKGDSDIFKVDLSKLNLIQPQ